MWALIQMSVSLQEEEVGHAERHHGYVHTGRHQDAAHREKSK